LKANCRRAVLLIVVLTTGLSDVLVSQFSLSAMACCAKAHHQCAGLRTPDDCCQGMGQGIGPTVTRPPAARVGDVGPALAILPVITDPTPEFGRVILPSATFKKPHDPAHLHPVALLI
jgi:hypothetical protein